jgi:WD40 repeat protein
VAFSPDGKTLAIGTEDGAQLWNAHNRDLLGQLSGSSGEQNGNVTFSPDGTLLAVGYYSGSAPVQLWDVASRRLITTFPAYGGAVAFSPDGKTLAIGTEGGVQLWDVSSLRMVASVKFGNIDQVTALAFSPDGAILAISVQGGPTRLWAVASHNVVATLPAGIADPDVTAMRFNPGGTILAVAALNTLSTNHDGPTVTRLWAVPSGRLITTLPDGGGTQVDAMAFSPDGTMLATGDKDSTTQVWNVAAATNTPSAALTYGSAGETPPSVALSPDGATLAVGTGNAVQLWSVAAGRRTGTLLVGRGQEPASEVFSPDGATLAVGTGDGVQLWNVAARRLIKTIPGTDGTVGVVAFSPDGATLAVGTGNAVQLWNVAAGLISKVLPLGRGQGFDSTMAFSPDGTLLAVGASNNDFDNPGSSTQLWSVASGRLSATLREGVGRVDTVAFSPDGGTLAVGTDNGTQLWNVAHPAQAAHQIPQILPSEEGTDGEAVAYAPGTEALAVATSAGIQVWDAATGQEVIAHPAGTGNSGTPEGPPAFSAQGTLAVATSGGQVQLWRMPYLARPTFYLCGLAGQPFPEDEWAQDASGIAYQATCP